MLETFDVIFIGIVISKNAVEQQRFLLDRKCGNLIYRRRLYIIGNLTWVKGARCSITA